MASNNNQNGGFMGHNPKALIRLLERATNNMRRAQWVEQDNLYSAFFIPATAPVLRRDVFVTNRGAVGQGYGAALTERETNLLTAGRVPDEYGYVVVSVGVFWNAWANRATPMDYDEFASRTVLSYTLGGEKEKILGPVTMFPGGAGTTGVHTIANLGVMSNGEPGIDHMYALPQPIVLPPGSTFRFTFNTTGVGAAVLGALANVAAFDAWVRLICLRAAMVPNG